MRTPGNSRRRHDVNYATPSAIALIIANLLPLAGVVLFDWAVLDLMLLYWVENVVVGVINVLRMIAGRGTGRLFLIPFFAVHYGMFCFGHYTAISHLFGVDLVEAFAMPVAEALRSPMWIAVAGITLSHLFSFKFNFIDGKEYRRTGINRLMTRPYGRIVALHIAVIAGGFFITTLDNPLPALIVLIAGKIVFDLRMHTAERRVFAAA